MKTTIESARRFRYMALGSIGLKATTDIGTINLRLNGTTEGGDSAAWVSLLWSMSL